MLSVRHFRDLLESEVEFFTGQCSTWQGILKDEEKSISEEGRGKIQVAIGQTQLLMDKKFEQFRGLMKTSESSNGKEVTVTDIEGFWELLYIQVKDIHKKFAELEHLKKNNWEAEEAEPERQPLAALNNGSKVHRRKSAGVVKKDFSAEAKERLALAKAAMKRLQEGYGSENSVL